MHDIIYSVATLSIILIPKYRNAKAWEGLSIYERNKKFNAAIEINKIPANF